MVSSVPLKKIIKSFQLVLFCFIAAILLTGCWDRLEIEERAMVLGIAVDIAEPEEAADEGNTTHVEGSFQAPHHKLIKLTTTIAIPGRLQLGADGASTAGGSGNESEPVWVLEAVGHSLDDAISNLEQELAFEIFLGHVRVIVVSEQFAEQGIRELNDYLRRNSQIRRRAWLAVGKGEAGQYMKIAPGLERISTLYLVSTFEQAVRDGKLPNAFLGIYWSMLSSKGQDGFLPYIEKKERDNVKITGLAYFNEDTLAGIADPLEIGYIMSINNEAKAGYKALVPMEDDTVILEATSRRRRILSEIRNGKPHFTIRELLELNISEKNGPQWSINHTNDIEKIERKAQELAKQGREKLIKKMQEKRSDIFGFGEMVRAKHPNYWNKHVQTKKKWKEIFPDVTVDIDVTFKIRRIGMKAR